MWPVSKKGRHPIRTPGRRNSARFLVSADDYGAKKLEISMIRSVVPLA